MTESSIVLELSPKKLLEKCDPENSLAAYYEILKRENVKVNLVSRETLAEGMEVLAAESVFPFEQIECDRFESYLDIGSGGGLPAIPIILLKNVESATLLERVSKKSLALERIVKGLGLRDHVKVEFRDLDQYTPPARFDLITLRLVKLSSKSMRQVTSMLLPGGYFVYYSVPPEDFSCSDLTWLSYCYKTAKNAPTKHFTIFQKK